MAARKKRSVVAARRNLLIALFVIAVLLVVALLSVPRLPRYAPESGAAAVTETDGGGDESGEGGGTTAPTGEDGSSSGSAPEESADTRAPAGERVASTRPSTERGRLAVVIDDVGNNDSDLDAFLSFPGKLTVAVLPALAYSRESAEKAAQAGKEVIVHMPMAAENGRYPGPGTLEPGADPNRLISLIAANLTSVPGAVGVNNHMGSLATADEQMMGIVLGYLKARGLYFLDSRTTQDTVIPSLAPSLGVPWLERDVFLDNEPTADYVNAALEEGLRLAREEGSAILIGHAKNQVVAAVLNDRYRKIRQRGYRFVTLQELLPASVARGE